MTDTVRYVLKLHCPERPGIVHAITGVLLEHAGDIRELKQFDDEIHSHVFTRIEFDVPADQVTAVHADMAELAADLGAEWDMWPEGTKRRILVMASKGGHCLNDLLYRQRVGDLPVEIAAVVSNHPTHRNLVEWYGIPFFHVPVTPDTKSAAEAKLLELIDRFDIDLVVLARYMQILSDSLTKELTGRAINIHHSFLPSFKGAKPYHQAWARGVKMVGATAHYVNSELDEGPIIAQRVIEVDHSSGPDDLARTGRDAECKALSDAVRWQCEGRVFLNAGRTVVLR